MIKYSCVNLTARNGGKMKNSFAYMRISTREERGLQKYSRQESALEKYARDNEIEYLLMFREDVSGKSFINRKEWDTSHVM